MIPFMPAATHEVENMPPHIGDQELCRIDRASHAM
jgi:hypothetical protein